MLGVSCCIVIGISVAFTRDTYTVGEGSEVEVCVETSGTSERGYVPLTMVASTGSKYSLHPRILCYITNKGEAR